jgi:hypothetical protein
VIIFGIDNSVPNNSLDARPGRQRLDIPEGKEVILFFGKIQPVRGWKSALVKQISEP